MALNLFRIKLEHVCGISEEMAAKIRSNSSSNKSIICRTFYIERKIPKGLKGEGVKTKEDYVIL